MARSKQRQQRQSGSPLPQQNQGPQYSPFAGLVSKVAGRQDLVLDNNPQNAVLQNPTSFALDQQKQLLYFTDSGSNAIFKLNLNVMAIETYAGGNGNMMYRSSYG